MIPSQHLKKRWPTTPNIMTYPRNPPGHGRMRFGRRVARRFSKQALTGNNSSQWIGTGKSAESPAVVQFADRHDTAPAYSASRRKRTVCNGCCDNPGRCRNDHCRQSAFFRHHSYAPQDGPEGYRPEGSSKGGDAPDCLRPLAESPHNGMGRGQPDREVPPRGPKSLASIPVPRGSKRWFPRKTLSLLTNRHPTPLSGLRTL